METPGLSSAYFEPLVRDNLRLSSSPAVRENMDPGSSGFMEMLERAKASSLEPENENQRLNAPSSGFRSGNAASVSAKQPIDKTDKLYELCLDLETFIIKNLLTSMRNTVQKSGLVDDSFAGKIYEDMLYDEYAKDFTKNA